MGTSVGAPLGQIVGNPSCPVLLGRVGHSTVSATRAGVTQLVEYLLPKQDAAGSSPVARSKMSFFKEDR